MSYLLNAIFWCISPVLTPSHVVTFCKTIENFIYKLFLADYKNTFIFFQRLNESKMCIDIGKIMITHWHAPLSVQIALEVLGYNFLRTFCVHATNSLRKLWFFTSTFLCTCYNFLHIKSNLVQQSPQIKATHALQIFVRCNTPPYQLI